MALFINGVGQDTFNMNGVSIDNLYVDGVLVWTSIPEVAGIPRYELTEVLVDPSTVDDSANSLPDFNGLLTESDGTTPYEPTELQYPRNGLLELANGRIMDTQFDIDFENNSYAAYGIYDADGSTTYKIWAISISHGVNIYSLYEGDQDTPIAYVDIYSMPANHFPVPWTVTDGRPSWMPQDTLRTPAYISLNSSGVSTPEPPDIDVFGLYSKSTELTAIPDIDGNATDYTCQLLQIFDSGTGSGTITGDNSGCVSDYEADNAPFQVGTVNMEVYLPAGTFEFLVNAETNFPDTPNHIVDFTIDGQTQTIDASTNNVDGFCKTFTIVSPGQMYTLVCAPTSGGTNSVLNAFRITEVTP